MFLTFKFHISRFFLPEVVYLAVGQERGAGTRSAYNYQLSVALLLVCCPT